MPVSDNPSVILRHDAQVLYFLRSEPKNDTQKILMTWGRNWNIFFNRTAQNRFRGH